MKPRHTIQIGDTFGKLTVIDNSLSKQYKSGKKAVCKVKCVCNKTWEVQNGNLLSGNTKSCGNFPCVDRASNIRYQKPGQQAANFIFSNYKRSAERRDIKFKITKQQFFDLTSKNCFYCNSLPSNKTKDRNLTNQRKKLGVFIYNGLDRINPNGDYTLDNVVPACITCNRAKNNLSIQEWNNWIKRLIQHHSK